MLLLTLIIIYSLFDKPLHRISKRFVLLLPPNNCEGRAARSPSTPILMEVSICSRYTQCLCEPAAKTKITPAVFSNAVHIFSNSQKTKSGIR